MASNYPGSLDSFDTIASDKKTSDSVGGRTHRQMHNDLGDAIEAVQGELGTDPAGAYATVKARFEAIEANDWVTSARIAADAVGTSEIAANAVGSSELADNAVDTAAIADGAVTSAKIADGTIVAGDVAASTFAAFGTVGNLLTANQASAESGATTGWSSHNATFTASTDRAVDGTYSFKLVTTSDATVWMGHDTGVGNYTPVTAGETYTATVDWYVPSTNTGTIGSAAGPIIYWYTAAGVYVSDTGGVLGAPPEDAWTTRKVTAVAPATAAYARLFSIYTLSSYLKANDVVYIDRVGLWKGASGRWAMPGVPIPGQSAIAVNNAVHLSDTGTPEGVITAAPGSTFLQTDSTTDVKGWIRWVKATGTGNTGWVAGPEADTGWRNVSADIDADWALADTAGELILRRVGNVVHFAAGLKRVTASGTRSAFDVIYALPVGYRRRSADYAPYCHAQSVTLSQIGNVAPNAAFSNIEVAFPSGGTYSAGEVVRFAGTWTTENAWPSSLPGSAA